MFYSRDLENKEVKIRSDPYNLKDKEERTRSVDLKIRVKIFIATCVETEDA
jgi:hypothetical protein